MNQQPREQNLVITLVNAHAETIEAQKKLMNYMSKHIADLEQSYNAKCKELDALKQESDQLRTRVNELSHAVEPVDPEPALRKRTPKVKAPETQ
jgi:polyhydroxyalkanoate synthesis regulator phasin